MSNCIVKLKDGNPSLVLDETNYDCKFREDWLFLVPKEDVRDSHPLYIIPSSSITYIVRE